jgi:TetR/AcrR family transcriptional regulator
MSGIREKQLQKRKQETLDVALRLLMERGYANLNMDELAEEVGISKPTLYQYFESKDALAAQAMARMFEKLEELIDERSEKSPVEHLEHLLRLMLQARSEKRFMLAPADIERMRSIHQNYPPIAGHRLAIKNKLEQIVRQGQALGEIDPALPAWLVASAVFSLQSIISNPGAMADIQRSEAERAAAIESIVRLFKHGVGVALPIPS